MEPIETKRLVLRAFTPGDWSDVHELAVDWSKAPGPEFDKWPTSEDKTRGMAEHFAGNENFFAVYLRDEKKVIGLLGLNGVDSSGRLDLGHVILSEYQDNDHDKEALQAMVNHIFEKKDVLSIVTRNASTHAEQLAPLKALGLKNVNSDEKGELVITKAEWGTPRQK